MLVQEFYSFLRKNDCYRKWLNNITKLCPTYFLSLLTRNDIARNSISRSFIWSYTKEGYSYWNDISKKWVVYYDENR